ncbi:MAG TPA: hypothetical protein VF620_02840 [Allosphingosinicella sp.]
MNIRRALILGMVFIGGGSSLSATTPPAARTVVSAEEERIFEGDWQGPFGEGTLRFRFEFANGSWRGWFVSQKDGSLYPLKNVAIGKGEVNFTHLSEPNLIFHLKLDADKKTLSGISTLPDGMALPRSLSRL